MGYHQRFNVLAGLGLVTATGLAFKPASVLGFPLPFGTLGGLALLATIAGYAVALSASRQSVPRQRQLFVLFAFLLSGVALHSLFSTPWVAGIAENSTTPWIADIKGMGIDAWAAAFPVVLVYGLGWLTNSETKEQKFERSRTTRTSSKKATRKQP